MNRVQKTCACLFASALFATSVAVLSPCAVAQSAAPPAAAAQNGAEGGQQLQTTSGKVTSVSGKTFTVQSSGATGAAMTFTVNDASAVSGQLKVGADAEVTYKTQGSDNVVVSVKVAS